MIDSLFRILATTAPDFSVYYYSAKNLIAGRNIYEDPTLFTGFGYPPVTAALFIPLTFLPYQIAQALWIVASIAVLLGSIAICMRLFGFKKKWQTFAVIALLAYFSFPTRFTLGMGQVNLIALFLLLLGVAPRKRLLGAIFLGTSILLKPQFVLILLFLFSWRVVVFVAFAVMVTGVVFGWTQWMTYLQETIPPLLAYQGREIYYNQGIGGTFARLFPLEVAKPATLLASAMALFVTPLEAVAVFPPLLLLIEPLSWQHHYVWLLPTYLWVWRKIKGEKWLQVLLLLSYLLVSWNIKQPAPLSVTLGGNILLSHVFIGNLIVFGLSLYAFTHHRTSG